MFVGEARSLAANTRLGWKGFIIQAPSKLGVILQKLARDTSLVVFCSHKTE
jgi:hypothetical protein